MRRGLMLLLLVGSVHAEDVWKCGAATYQQEPCHGGKRMNMREDQNVVRAVPVERDVLYEVQSPFAGRGSGIGFAGTGGSGVTGYSYGTPLGTFSSNRPLSIGSTSWRGRFLEGEPRTTSVTVDGVTWRPKR